MRQLDFNSTKLGTTVLTQEIVLKWITANHTVPSDISSIGFGGITEIQESAFTQLTNLAQLKYFNTVNIIGNYAFENTKLNNITVYSDQIYGKGVFKNCKSLTKVYFEKGKYKKVTESMFEGCINLQTIINDDFNVIETAAFKNTKITILNCTNLSSIAKKSYSGCEQLKRITNSNNLILIDDYAFASCYNFPAKIELSSCTEIGRYAFLSCQNLSSLNAPNCTFVDYNAFYGTHLWDVDPEQQ